ncbi:Mn2+/Fe2+ transporter [Halovenus rubra]|uniref:Mn2+/Fe2+ transporter n=2 Tax=Halovenus rubra TaxID=869890 RepID=A0ACC7DYR6_9EURY|nr:hypothetical protein [Halovenus rubra]
MLSESPPRYGVATILIIGSCSLIGLLGSIEQAGETGPLKTWLWIGMGLAGLYLLTVIANGVDQLNPDH